VNDLVEHKSRHRVASGNHAGGSGFTTVPLSAVTKLKQRKYVRKKTFNSIPLHRSSSSSSDESV
ncbi:hypothetical protein pipiens_000511, partial [Culex pipiens pipiens]